MSPWLGLAMRSDTFALPICSRSVLVQLIRSTNPSCSAIKRIREFRKERGHHCQMLPLSRELGCFTSPRGRSYGSGANEENGSANGDNGQMTTPPLSLDLFKGRHFDQEIIVLCVQW